MMGTVKWFNETKGMGMIEAEDDTRQDILVRVGELRGTRKLEEGQRVSFDVVRGPRGAEAQSVEVIG